MRCERKVGEIRFISVFLYLGHSKRVEVCFAVHHFAAFCSKFVLVKILIQGVFTQFILRLTNMRTISTVRV